MQNGYKFTCIASTYGVRGGLKVTKGWSITLHQSDQRVHIFLGNPAFKSERAYVPDAGVAAVTTPKTKAEDPNKAWKDVGIENVVDLGDEIIGKLQKAGLATVNAVLGAGKPGLVKIKGVDNTEAEKILALVAPYGKDAKS